MTNPSKGAFPDRDEAADKYQDKLIEESTAFPSLREYAALVGRTGFTTGWDAATAKLEVEKVEAIQTALYEFTKRVFDIAEKRSEEGYAPEEAISSGFIEESGEVVYKHAKAKMGEPR